MFQGHAALCFISVPLGAWASASCAVHLRPLCLVFCIPRSIGTRCMQQKGSLESVGAAAHTTAHPGWMDGTA